MKKKMNILVPIACLSVGVGSLMYSYMKMHPIKTAMVKADVKNAMKDLK